MKRFLFACLVLSSLLAIVPTSHAASIGANFGFTHYLPKSGDGLSLVGLPNNSMLGLFAPGMRVTMPLGTDGRASLVLDAGLNFMSVSGSSMHMIGLLGGYQYAFSEAADSPYVTVAAGLNSVGGSGISSVNNLVLGGGVGLRHRLPHDKGSLRAELHVDHEFDSEDSTNSLTAIGLKLGFDVEL